MKATSGSTRAFDKAVRVRRMADTHCAELLERDDLSAEDRERIRAFRDVVSRKRIDEFTEDTSDRVRREIKEAGVAFFAGFGLNEPFGTWL